MNLLAIRTSNSNEKNILCSRHLSYEIIHISKNNNNHNNKIFTYYHSKGIINDILIEIL